MSRINPCTPRCKRSSSRWPFTPNRRVAQWARDEYLIFMEALVSAAKLRTAWEDTHQLHQFRIYHHQLKYVQSLQPPWPFESWGAMASYLYETGQITDHTDHRREFGRRKLWRSFYENVGSAA